MNGGNGIDGETLLTWLDPVEMGGTLLLEAVGVTLSPGSTGILAGFFIGLEDAGQLHCRVSSYSAARHRGSDRAADRFKERPAGTTYAINPANQYTLRVRVHCPEFERALAIYRSFGDSGAITCGGAVDTASGQASVGDSGVCERRGGDAGDAL